MRSIPWLLLLSLVFLGTAAARDIVLPAGTLLQCTLDEPNFSSATAEVGDPILCHPRAVQMFGQSVFPRGAYIVGHLEAAKDPGHFAGKGYMKLQFDRIGLPSTDLPLPGKVIAVRGYRVDREGKVIGHGHPTRDAVEWMLPPLWPWKLITLPARGPRPALKGEVTVTMRLMDDVAVPQPAMWRRFGDSGDASLHFRESAPAPAPASFQTSSPRLLAEGAGEVAVNRASAEQVVTRLTSRAPADGPITLFALKDGSVYAARDYSAADGTLDYTLASGHSGSFALSSVDWDTTTRLNSERGVRVTLRRRPALQAATLQ